MYGKEEIFGFRARMATKMVEMCFAARRAKSRWKLTVSDRRPKF
jgi:ribosomal protein L34